MGKNKSGKKVKVVSDLGFIPDGLSDKKMRKQIKKIEKENKKAKKNKKEQESFFAFKLDVSKDDIEVEAFVDEFFAEDDKTDIEILGTSFVVENLRQDIENAKIIKHIICDKEYLFISKDPIALLSVATIVSDMFVDGYNVCLDYFMNPPHKHVVLNDIAIHDDISFSEDD